jgi:hypothetical protein
MLNVFDPKLAKSIIGIIGTLAVQCMSSLAFCQSNDLQPDAIYAGSVKMHGERVIQFYARDPADESTVVSICFVGPAFHTLLDCETNLNWKRFPNLEHVCFYQADVTEDMLLYIGDLKGVSKLEFESCKLRGNTTRGFGSLKYVTRLSAFFDSKELDDFNFLGSLRSLEYLAIGEAHNAIALCNVAKCEQLEELYISVREDFVMDCLSSLSRLRRLSVFGLKDPKSTISQIAKLSNIEALHLEGTYLDPQDLRAITSIGSLHELFLSRLSPEVTSSDVYADSNIRDLSLVLDVQEAVPAMFEFISQFKKLERLACYNYGSFPLDLRTSLKEVVLPNEGRIQRKHYDKTGSK